MISKRIFFPALARLHVHIVPVVFPILPVVLAELCKHVPQLLDVLLEDDLVKAMAHGAQVLPGLWKAYAQLGSPQFQPLPQATQGEHFQLRLTHSDGLQVTGEPQEIGLGMSAPSGGLHTKRAQQLLQLWVTGALSPESAKSGSTVYQ